MSQPPRNRKEAEARLNAAVAARRAGRPDEAVHIAQEIVDARPKFSGALRLLGRIALDRRQYMLAVRWFERAVEAKKSDAAAWQMLGAAHLYCGSSTAALKAYETALRLEPDTADAITGKADALERLGRLEAMEKLLGPLVTEGRATPHMNMVMMRGLVGAKRDQDAVDLAARVLDADAADGPARTMWLLAGRSHERLGAIDSAFGAYSRGNAIAKRPFSRGDFDRLQNAIGTLYDPGRAEPLPQSTETSSLPIFVFGLPRSGTTLVEQIIHAHPQAAAAGECHDLTHTLRMLSSSLRAPWPQCAARAGGQDLTDAAGRYLKQLRRTSEQALRVVDKSLENHDLAGFIHQLLPAAKMIHVVRKPIDVCFAIWTENLDPGMHAYASEFADIAHIHRANRQLRDLWRTTLGDAYLEVDYETLVEDPDAGIRAIIDFAGLPWHDDCLRFHEADREAGTLSNQQVRQPMYRSSVNRADAFGDRLDELRRALDS